MSALQSVWQPRPLAGGECLYWRIGPLQIWIQYRSTDRRVVYLYGSDPLDTALEQGKGGEPPSEAPAIVQRIGGNHPTSAVQLFPAMPDRSIVYRPQHPFSVLPQDEIRLFVSIPLWIRPCLFPDKRELKAIPIFRFSDTWFGPNTRIGELCYASRTTMRLAREELIPVAQRAVCMIRIRNLAAKMLEITRLRVPVDLLGLYQGTDGRFWVNDLILESSEEQEGEGVQVQEGVSGVELASPEPVVPARHQDEKNVLSRVFQSILQ